MVQTFMAKASLDKFTVLVVDDDPTSLSIVSAMLKSWQYEVVTVKSPVDALSTIRTQHERIDLVVTDLHMPQMNGIELQKQIDEEFNKLPVIIMSSDDRESVILKSLAGGAVFYIVKPVNPGDLKNVWQYAVASKKGKSIFIEEIGSIQFGRSSAEKISHDEDIISASSVNEEKHGGKKDSKRKASKKCKDHLGENSIAPKKAKVVWTNSLHNRFLQAIKQISLEKAVPKKILECMNVPGLTRENVASHLQKYRIFLKRVAEKGACTATRNFSGRQLTSSFAASGQSSLVLKHAHQDYQQFMGKQPIRTSLQPVYGGNISALGVTNFGSSNNSASQLGLQGNQTNLHQPIFSNTNPLYQLNRTTFGTGSNDFETNMLPLGGTSGGLMNSTNSMQMYHQQSGIWKPSYNTLGNENMKTFNNPYSNYSGMRMTDDMDQTTLFGFDHGNYQFPSAFARVNEQGNTLVLPPVLQQQYGLGNDGQCHFPVDLMNTASAFGNIAHPQQLGEGNISDILFGGTNHPFPYQQQGGEGVPNPSFPSSLHLTEVNPSGNPSLNPDLISSAFGVEGKDPWINEPSLKQLQEIEEAMNSDLDNGKHPLDDYFPSFDENPNQQQGNKDYINSQLNGLLIDNAPNGNQDWDEEFLNSLFGDRPF